jgi:hypothetical protein
MVVELNVPLLADAIIPEARERDLHQLVEDYVEAWERVATSSLFKVLRRLRR